MADSTDGRERGIGWSHSIERWLELQEVLPLRRVPQEPVRREVRAVTHAAHIDDSHFTGMTTPGGA